MTKFDENILLECRLHLKELIPGLSNYETEILSVLLSVDEPLTVGQIIRLTDIPKTKIYGTMRKLEDTRLVKEVFSDISKMVKPPVYEYWSQTRRNRFLEKHMTEKVMFQVVFEALLQNWDIMTAKYNRLSEFVDFVKKAREELEDDD